MKILVTGGAGYIGSKLASRLLRENYKVRVIDCLPSGEKLSLPFYDHPAFEFVWDDIRDRNAVSKSLEGMDAVIHLAAITAVSGSESAYQQKMIEEVNYQATCDLVDLYLQREIGRFIFTSTCSNYGVTDPSKFATEGDPLEPTSPYAKSKVKAEEHILNSTNMNFHPTILRLATVFGLSPRMSYQPMLNAFVREAVTDRSLILYSPYSWRPFIHVEDVVTAILLVLQAPLKLVSGEVFNVGSNSLNRQKIQLANLIKKQLPQARIEIKEGAVNPRDYKVSFDKIGKVLGFKASKSLEEGVKEVMEELERIEFRR